MKTKTFPAMVQKVCKALGTSGVVSHTPTDTNRLGQSGVHTFVSDVISIVLNSKNEHDAWRRLHSYLEDGEVDVMPPTNYQDLIKF